MSARSISRPRVASSVKSEINVTPLCDVMLVLLIIFMIVAPLFRGLVPVSLPRALHPRAVGQDDETLVLTLRSDGLVFLDGNLVREPDVPSRLTAAPLGAKLILRADERLDYERVQSFMETVRHAGFVDIALATEDLGPKSHFTAEAHGR